MDFPFLEFQGRSQTVRSPNTRSCSGWFGRLDGRIYLAGSITALSSTRQPALGLLAFGHELSGHRRRGLHRFARWLKLFPLSANEVGGEGRGEVARFKSAPVEAESIHQPSAEESDGFAPSASRRRSRFFDARHSRSPTGCLRGSPAIDGSKSAIPRLPLTPEIFHVPRHAGIALATHAGTRPVR